MDVKKRLKLLLEHNIEHNKQHIDKLREMAEEGREFGVSDEIRTAADLAERSNESLKTALVFLDTKT